MKNQDTIKNKKIFVLGLGQSGQAAAKLCANLGSQVLAYDANDLSASQTEKDLIDQGIEVISGSQDTGLIDPSFDMMIKSPGIPYHNPLIKEADKWGLPVYTDVELAYILSEAPIIGITGSNGKTTVTTLIGEIFQQSHLKGLISGNIGIPVSQVVQEAKSSDYLIMELSSFQLMGTEQFKPKIACVTNLYSAHLDYHGSRQAYLEAKKKIIINQNASDYFVYNAEDHELCEWAETCQAQAVPFSSKRELGHGVYMKEDNLFYNSEKIISREDILIPGDHNLENVCAAVSVAKLIGVENSIIQRVLRDFSGVHHRLQYIGQVQGRSFYNDSKATNVLASQQALKSFDQPVIWLCGGLDRKENLTPLLELVKNKVKAMLVMGENRMAFQDLAKEAAIESVYLVESMEEAVKQAYEISSKHDIILLSPASASWDQYSSFEIRGDVFIENFENLKAIYSEEE